MLEMRMRYYHALCLALVGLVPLAGCKSASQYVAPRVTGRVVDSETQRPIERVKVRRISADDLYRRMDMPKGGELLQQHSFVYSASDGSFALDSVRTLAPFGNAGWWSITLSFEHSGYETLSTTYGLARSTNSVKGEPVIDAGDILLAPGAK